MILESIPFMGIFLLKNIRNTNVATCNNAALHNRAATPSHVALLEGELSWQKNQAATELIKTMIPLEL